MIHIDGSIGEGGGQILRTALSLSLLTGKAFTLNNIRAGRKKPGLMRQHLVCVSAAKAIGHAIVVGDTLGSKTLTFEPQTVQAGTYHFAIGSAGSTLLVMQTLLPVLMMQTQPSTVTIEGGTHNPMAPTADFMQHSFLPALAQMGVEVSFENSFAGFFPVGAGHIKFTVQPWQNKHALSWLDRGELFHLTAEAMVQNLEYTIAEREMTTLKALLPLTEHKITERRGASQGNSVWIVLQYAGHQQVFTMLGEHGTSADNIAKRLAGRVKAYLKQQAVVEEYLADQLLLPLALGVGGQFTATTISNHTKTQAEMIQLFLDVDIQIKESTAGAEVKVLVSPKENQ